MGNNGAVHEMSSHRWCFVKILYPNQQYYAWAAKTGEQLYRTFHIFGSLLV